MSRLFLWIIHRLMKGVYKGLTEYDTINYELLTDKERTRYLKLAREVKNNETFIAELQRLRYVQERKLVNESKTLEDLVWGKASLYTIDLIQKRFERLAKELEVNNQEEIKARY